MPSPLRPGGAGVRFWTIAIVWSGLAGGSSPISGEFTGPPHPEARRVIIANTGGGAAIALPGAPLLTGETKKRPEARKRASDHSHPRESRCFLHQIPQRSLA